MTQPGAGLASVTVVAHVFAVLILCLFGSVTMRARAAHAAGGAATGSRKGATLYVSKLGDNSDGSSWAKAFRTIQAGLNAIPDAKGGHRVIIRPDTYMEANLWPAHKGASGAYNVLQADFDGRLGSGATGYAVIDCGDPGKGFKSYDWWGPFRAYKKGWSKAHTEQTFSAIVWDRWIFRRLYTAGGDGGLFWDCVDKVEPFTVVVEDCVGTGRAFGGGVGSCLSRADEPIVFRRCQLWCLDWWGDAAGAYVRVENPEMPDHPDVIFDDCTLVGPDNALKSGNPGFATYTRVKVTNSRLVTLNFSQPHGKPSTGIIHSTMEGKLLHVDLKDSTLMGYKLFGAGKARKAGEDVGEVGYTTTGSVRAYVQFQQEVPKGFTRLTHWPVETFKTIVPSEPPPCRPALVKEGLIRKDMCEVTPLVWRGRLCLMECYRPGQGGTLKDYYLTLNDVESGKELARFAEGYGLASAIVHDKSLYVFASRFDADRGPWNDVTLFKSADLKQWDHKLVIEQESEHLFNSSVCAGPDGFVMAYETSDPKYPAFSVKFARSKNLVSWTKVPDVVFGTDRYTACPCIRYVNGSYYMMYLERHPPRWYFTTYVARSKDLATWELSPANPVLAPDGDDEGINASDPDIVEFGGKTYLYYNVGDQRTWGNVKRAVYDGSMRTFFEAYFRDR